VNIWQSYKQRTWLSRALCAPGQHTAKRRRKSFRAELYAISHAMALIRRSDEKNFSIFSNSVSFGQGDPVPPPRLQVFSSDFGNSHDPAGLYGAGVGGRCPPPCRPWLRYCACALLTGWTTASQQHCYQSVVYTRTLANIPTTLTSTRVSQTNTLRNIL